MQPTPEPRPALEAANDPRVTEIALLNPSIFLLEAKKRLSVLLSRDTIIERDRIRLRGARLIHIPVGWRLRILRLGSRFHLARLPDETDFLEVQIIKPTERSAYAQTDARILCAIENPNLLLPLTGREYQTLIAARGRDLHRWIADHFGTGMGTKPRTPFIRDRRWAA